MAKLAFSKLGLKVNNETINIHFNDQVIEVKKYISINDKLDLISDVLNKSFDAQNNFANPVKVKVYIALNIIQYYTNINFTEKQRQDPVKLYDCLESSGLLNQIIQTIPSNEYAALVEDTETTIKAFYAHKDSIYGILETVKEDYGNLDLNATALQEKIGNPENLELLKDILDKLG